MRKAGKQDQEVISCLPAFLIQIQMTRFGVRVKEAKLIRKAGRTGSKNHF
jgi:hypothetical protein